jgi:hypothetical protein
MSHCGQRSASAASVLWCVIRQQKADMDVVDAASPEGVDQRRAERRRGLHHFRNQNDLSRTQQRQANSDEARPN